MREWLVGGGIVVSDHGVLLVQNRRRDGRLDWSPPGGVIDEGETLVGGLTREVEEETGLRVAAWDGPTYEIRAVAPDMGWSLSVEAYLATDVAGSWRSPTRTASSWPPATSPSTSATGCWRPPPAGCASPSPTGSRRRGRAPAPTPTGSPAPSPAATSRSPAPTPDGAPAAGAAGTVRVLTAVSPRTILHVDMDAFFVSVELLRRPELRGRPVVVGGHGPRGVVAAASYEARSYGVFSAMPSARARSLCPHAVFLPGDHAHYGEVSGRVMAIFRSITPLVEPLSLDEAFLDATGARLLHGDGPTIAATLRRRVWEEEGLTCSVGVSAVKFLAKLATTSAKPRASREGPVFGSGVAVIPPGEELAFLHPLPVKALWGVGPATLARLERFGVRTVADLAELPRATLESAVGKAHGGHLHDLAHGIDPRTVDPDQAVKSISHEETYPTDLFDPEGLRREAVRMADAVAARLRAHDVVGRTVTVKVRFGDFRTITRSATPPEPVSTGPSVARVAKELLARVDVSPGVRLLGVGVSGLVPPGTGSGRQLSLLDDEPSEAATAPDGDWSAATDAIDRVRARYGADAVVPATLAGTDGIRVRRRGDQQWGPDRPPAPGG